MEIEKLQERLKLAQDEYSRGLAKLKATASELQSLSSRVWAVEKSARGEWSFSPSIGGVVHWLLWCSGHTP
jgi:hypothetical protein